MTPDLTTHVSGPTDESLRRLARVVESAEMHGVTDPPPLPPTATAEYPPVESVDYIVRVLWSARALIRDWDAAGVLYIASRTGAGVQQILTDIQSLRAALEEQP